jgi:hypothetical protein
VFFLDDEDRALVGRRRGEHMKVGFAIQLVTVRCLGTFLEDPLDVPGAVLDFVAWQLGVADPAQVKQYTERTFRPARGRGARALSPLAVPLLLKPRRQLRAGQD